MMTRLALEMSVDEENLHPNGLEKSRDPQKSKEWFGVQLEVVNLLLEAERRKLCVLQRELKTALAEGGSIKAKEHQKQELITAIQRIQVHYDDLEKECRDHAIGALKASNTRGIGKGSKRENHLESGKEGQKRAIENGAVSESLHHPPTKSNEGKPKPPVPPKRSTLTFGKSYVSVGGNNAQDVFSPTGGAPSSESSEDPCQPLTSHLVSVTTNILSSAPKALPTPKLKNQRVLSTFLPALPPKYCKSPQVQSPNFVRSRDTSWQKEPESVSEVPPQKPVRRTSEKDSTSPSSLSSTKTLSSSASFTLEKDLTKDDSDLTKSSIENTPKKATDLEKEFSPSQSPPDLPISSPNSEEKSPPLPELPESKPSSKTSSLPNSPPSPPKRSEVKGEEKNASEVSPQTLKGNEAIKKTENDDAEETSQPFYLEESNEKTNTIKRAPSNDHRNSEPSKDKSCISGIKLRPKSPIRVSFAKDDENSCKIYEKLSRTKRATKELKNIIHQIEYSESDYCSDDNCRTCGDRKTSSLSRRRSASPKTTFSKSFDQLEGYTSCCEEGTIRYSKKTKSLTRKVIDKKGDATYGRVLCNCPLDNLVIDNKVPFSRPNSSIGDYCTQPSKSKSVIRAKKNSAFGIKTPFWHGGSKFDYESPGLSLIITISSDGIDKEPKRTVQFISGGPAVNFGLGGTLGRYTKCKSQDKSLKISGFNFHADHSVSDFEEVSDWGKPPKAKVDHLRTKKSQIQEETSQISGNKSHSDNSFPTLERQKSAGELRRPRYSKAAEEYQKKYLEGLNRKKSPGEVLEHFGKLATSVTTSEISKISDVKKKEESEEHSVASSRKNFDRASKAGNHHENYRTVPPASFNNPNTYLGSAFVQYVRETLPHQPNSFPVGAAGGAFNKYIRPGSGRFDKSFIFPQPQKSDKPSAFERLCGDKIYASRRGIHGKSSAQTQSVSGSLDCVWGKPKPEEQPQASNLEERAVSTAETRPASCTYEINRIRPAAGAAAIGGAPNSLYSNYSPVAPLNNKSKIISGQTIPRTSMKGIIEPEASSISGPQSTQALGVRILGPQGTKTPNPQYFNPRRLEDYKLGPGFKTDLSTLYSGVFYTNPKVDAASSKSSDSARILNEYGIKYGSLNRNKEDPFGEKSAEGMGGSSSSARGASADAGPGRKSLTTGAAPTATPGRIPEEAAPGVTVTYPPQYHPSDEELMQDNEQSNRSQPAIGLKQTPKSRPTIFGTVASDQIPKDGSSKRSLPQTTLGASNGGLTEYSSSLESVQESTTEKDNALVYRDGNLVSGSMEALVQHMVPTAEYYPDRAYLFAFLLSSRLFIKPHELLGEVCALCDSQQHLGGKDPPSKERLGRFIPHFVQLLAEWTETFPYDFRDERVMVHVRNITQKCVAVDPLIRKEVSTLLQNLLVRLTTLEKYEEFLVRISAENSTDSMENLNSTDVTELCSSPGLLAQQLTHIELERLSYIGPEEFVQAFAKENPNLGTSFKDMKKTRNLESYVSWFNRLSYLVATDVCKHVKKKQRVRVMEYWIETARECFNIGNFNSLMAIIAGLNMSPVARLKKTWSKIQSGKFSVLEHQMDPSSNFSSYRSTLKAAMWRSAGATDQRQRIVIPFFSLLVKDLYFLNEGCSNKLPNGHINFEKFWQLAKQVTEFITWKQVTCPFDKCTKVITFLQASPVLTENALALASFECEPPENNQEKERYKSLK